MSLRILLFPFSILYGLIISIRNLLFDTCILRSRLFPFPVIVIGNLSTGGTGKTPHVAYIVNLLKEKSAIATLSRGYGRKTEGFLLADDNSTATTIGDEPMLYYHRFGKKIIVGVGEDRVNAIEKIKQSHPQTQTIVLDDAYQHRYVKAGLNILLTDFHHPYFNDHLLPVGNLRETKNGMKRANAIIITKCPNDLSSVVQKTYTDKINPRSHQQVFFSGLKYSDLISMNDPSTMPLSVLKDYQVLLVTGIANPQPMKEHLEKLCTNVYSLKFKDHYSFKYDDILFIEENFNTIAAAKKIIITTEKDAMRLLENQQAIEHLPLYYLPIEIYFINNSSAFDQLILDYVRKN